MEIKKYFAYFIFFIGVNLSVYAEFSTVYNFSYISHTDDVDELTYARMHNQLFIGASVDSDRHFYLGQNIHMWSNSHQDANSANESKLSFFELGPKIILYFGTSRALTFTATYNLILNGTRIRNGVTEELIASSYIVSLGYQFSLGKNFSLGATVLYHGLSVKQSVVDTVKTTVAESYTSIVPMLEFGMSFR